MDCKRPSRQYATFAVATSLTLHNPCNRTRLELALLPNNQMEQKRYARSDDYEAWHKLGATLVSNAATRAIVALMNMVNTNQGHGFGIECIASEICQDWDQLQA